MFFEGALAAPLGFDYAHFSLRLNESELPSLLSRLDAVPPQHAAPVTQAAQPGQRWRNGNLPLLSWQAVADKASILRLPGMPDCLDWR